MGSLSLEALDGNLNNEDKLEASFKPIIKFGEIIGLSCQWFSSSLSMGQGQQVKFPRWKRVGLKLVEVLATVCVGVNASVTFVEFCHTIGKRNGDRNLISMAEDGLDFLFILTGAFIYFYFLVRPSSLSQFLAEWKTTIKALCHSQPDLSFVKTSKVVTWLMLTSMLIQWVVHTLTLTPFFSPNTSTKGQIEEEVGFDPLMTFFWHLYKERGGRVVPFHPLSTCFLFLTDTLAFFAWNLVDLLIILISRGIGGKFKSLCAEVEKRRSIEESGAHKLFWIRMRGDHVLLSFLLRSTESFLSPLILISVSTNVYSISLLVHEVLIPSGPKTPIESAYRLIFLSHLLLRLILLTFFTSRMHDSAHGIVSLCQKWDSPHYSTEMERLERYLGSHSIAFTGLNCFILTRSFVLVVLSILLTLEIVLLQAHPPSASFNINATQLPP